MMFRAVLCVMAGLAVGAASAARAAVVVKECVTNASGFKQAGAGAFYAITVRNGCSRRLRCTVYASIMTSRDAVRRERTLVLAASGAGATGTVRIPVKAAGGMANVSYECRTT